MEVIILFRNGRWSKNNNVNTNTNKSNIDNGNRRPQYYAERRLPLFEDGAGITSGLVRAGWSHGNNKGVSTNNTNIPSLSETKSSGKTPVEDEVSQVNQLNLFLLKLLLLLFIIVIYQK